jgi:hypothetical protein
VKGWLWTNRRVASGIAFKRPTTAAAIIPSMRRALVVLALALLTPLAGCGGGHKQTPPLSKSQYEQRMSAIAPTLAQATTQASASLGGPSLAGAATGIDDQAKALENAVKQLRKITPPADVRAEHRAFTNAVGALAAALHKTADAARTGDPTSLHAAGDFELAAQTARRAGERIAAKGYNVPGL